MPALEVGDPLAHRALQALFSAETAVRRTLSARLEREGLSTAGFSALVVLRVAGGELGLKALRRRLGWSKANATEVTVTLESRGLVTRHRLSRDRRAAAIRLTAEGAAAVDRLFPDHTRRVSEAFAALEEEEKRSLTDICRKLVA